MSNVIVQVDVVIPAEKILSISDFRLDLLFWIWYCNFQDESR